MIASPNNCLYAAGCRDLQGPGSEGDDLAFWVERARQFGSPILDLACGTGKLAMALAVEGYDVTAMDPSAPLLTECRKAASHRGLSIDWVHSDLEHFELDRRFPLVLLSHNTVGRFLEEKKLEACLTNARRHLTADGRLVLDAYSPLMESLSPAFEEKRPVLQYEDSNWNGTVVVSQSAAYDADRQVHRVMMFFRFPGSKHEIVQVNETRLYGREELETLLARCGLVAEDRYGDFDATPLTPDSSKQILVCAPID